MTMNATHLLRIQLQASVDIGAGRLNDGNFESLCTILERMAVSRATPRRLRRAIRVAISDARELEGELP